MSEERAIYYHAKGVVADLPAEQRAEAEQAFDEIVAIAGRSDVAAMGLALATTKFAMEFAEKR